MDKFFNLGLIGYPVEHSISPLLHNEAFKAAGLEGNYRLFPVLPLPAGKDGLSDIIERTKQGEIVGLNVTIPHKTAVIDYLDRLDQVAGAVEAVNTIYPEDSFLIGTNTDVTGFLKDLKRCLQTKFDISFPNNTPNNRHALVLGAGGAAKAVVYGLSISGWEVTIAARWIEQANKIAHRHNYLNKIPAINIISLDQSELLKVRSNISLVVNTTPLGMFPNTESCAWPDGIPLPEGAFVYDLVYNPVETKLVGKARSENLSAVTGLGMLVEQAVESFKIWTGVQVPRQVLWNAAIKHFDNTKRVDQK